MHKIFLLGLAVFFALGAEYDDGVLVLNDSNFHEEVAKYEHILVQFYAPWWQEQSLKLSGHCKKLAPEYAKAAATLAKQNPPLTIAKVDATENDKLAEEYGIKSFPTLKWVTDFGKTKSEYEGGRTESEIVNWINKRTGPASKQLSSVEEVEQAKKKNKLTVVYLGADGTDEFKTYESVARSMEKQAFFHMTCDEKCSESLKTGAAKLVLFKPFDELQNNFEGEFNHAAIRQFLNDNSLPMLIEFSEDYVEDIFGKSKNTLFLFADVNSQAYPSQKEVMVKLSEELKGKLVFSVSDVKEGMQQRLAEFLGIKDSELPTAYILKFGAKGIKKYKLASGGIDLDNLKNFISDFEGDKLTPTLKSQEPPTEEFENDVKVLVGKNFDKEVFGADKDVFVKFYAPWCGHCKKLAPTWSELGKELNKSDSVMIAKFDATENEVESVDIQGFPTLIYYKKGSKQGITYNGDREKSDLVDFIKDNASNADDIKKHLTVTADL